MHKLCQLNWKQTRFLIKIKARRWRGGEGGWPSPPLVERLTAPDTHWAPGWLQCSSPGPSVWRSCASLLPVEQRVNRIRNSAPRVFVWREVKGWARVVSLSVYISVFSVHHNPVLRWDCIIFMRWIRTLVIKGRKAQNFVQFIRIITGKFKWIQAYQDIIGDS